MSYRNIMLSNTVIIIFLIISVGLLIKDLNEQSKVIEYYQKKSYIYKEKYEDFYKKYNKIKMEYKTFIKEYFHCKVTVTAYTQSIDETNDDPDNTSLMDDPVSGWTCAVSKDLKYLLGKKVYIEGVGVRLVNDLMNNRHNKMVDVLVPNKKVARSFGKKKDVEVILIPDYNKGG